MKSGIHTVFAVLVLLCGPLIRAQDQAPDPENVPTPLTMPELLPEGGIDAVDVDFWMVIDVTHDGKPYGNARFMHWSAKPVDGKLHFVIETGRADDDRPHSHVTTVYTKAGELVSYFQVSSEHGRTVQEMEGRVVDGSLVMKTTTFDQAGEPTGTKTQSKPTDFFKTSVPSEWFSLIAAYHIRNGSLGYGFARTDLHWHYQPAETKLNDIGTEEVAFNGQTYTARLLKGTRTFGKADSGNTAELYYLVLPNGEMMYTRTLYYGLTFVGRRATREQVAEQFWLPGEAGKPEAEAGEAAPPRR